MNTEIIEQTLETLYAKEKEVTDLQDELRSQLSGSLRSLDEIRCPLPSNGDIHLESLGCSYHRDFDGPIGHGAIVSVSYDDAEGVLVTINDGETEEDVTVPLSSVHDPAQIARFCLKFADRT